MSFHGNAFLSVYLIILVFVCLLSVLRRSFRLWQYPIVVGAIVSVFRLFSYCTSYTLDFNKAVFDLGENRVVPFANLFADTISYLKEEFIEYFIAIVLFAIVWGILFPLTLKKPTLKNTLIKSALILMPINILIMLSVYFNVGNHLFFDTSSYLILFVSPLLGYALRNKLEPIFKKLPYNAKAIMSVCLVLVMFFITGFWRYSNFVPKDYVSEYLEDFDSDYSDFEVVYSEERGENLEPNYFAVVVNKADETDFYIHYVINDHGVGVYHVQSNFGEIISMCEYTESDVKMSNAFSLDFVVQSPDGDTETVSFTFGVDSKNEYGDQVRVWLTQNENSTGESELLEIE